MNAKLFDFLKKLRQYGLQKDIPNVTDEVGQFLNLLIHLQKPKTLLEIGCANGYSTIWMAEAVQKTGGILHTVDHSAPTFAEAQANLKATQLDSVVHFHFGDARQVIPAFSDGLQFDFVFVDGQKASYLDFWNLVRTRLTPQAVLVFDDMLAFPQKTKPFTEAIQNLKGFEKLLIPIDKEDGILILRKI